ncbi:class I SAM-dependent methyltransferase [Corynebacterium aquilae]|uniref:Methyltransferase type 11 domain-containing protein n=1 Tax=Corynebacterium aquilae DSM 44791 TaxID=1431546 RepID=A0A1L7CE79_9CORY|nr:class I SAM-dependent methyltransferase [Corynebacterium aquilae]APT84146.1 hypothetical protein CAQU_02635 [Corynebacterium aquilae DSM 44791]
MTDVIAGYWQERASSFHHAQAHTNWTLWHDIFAPYLNPNDRTVDLGCGTGFLSRALGQKHSPIGVDLTAGMLSFHPGPCLQADACALPLLSDSIDAIIGRNIAWTLPAAAWPEIARVLRPGAQLLLADGPWGCAPAPAGVAWREHYLSAYNEDTLNALPLARATSDTYAEFLCTFGFTDIAVRELTEVYDHELVHGTMPGHEPWRQFLITAVAPSNA